MDNTGYTELEIVETRRLLAEMRENCLRDGMHDNVGYRDPKRFAKARALGVALYAIDRMRDYEEGKINQAEELVEKLGFRDELGRIMEFLGKIHSGTENS